MAGQQENVAMACAAMEQDLVLYHYNELSGPERAAVEKHTMQCANCRHYLDEIRAMLVLTVERDDPEQPFWDQYSREMRQKLADAEERSWWRTLGGWLQSWTVPAMAATAIAIIALSFTLGKGLFRSSDLPPEDTSLMEMLPVAENLDFFSNMELLDSMDLLESIGASGSGQA